MMKTAMVASGRTLMLKTTCCVLLASTALAQEAPGRQNLVAQKPQMLWDKLESEIRELDCNLDGVMGVAIEDLTTEQKFFLHEDEVFPQASSIKIAVLTELYHQAQLSAEGASAKAKLTDIYIPSSPKTWSRPATFCLGSLHRSPVLQTVIWRR